MKGFIKEFKVFISTGNMIELAVAVILGAAVKEVITAFTNGVVMQLIAAIVGKPDFNSLVITLGDSPLYYGTVLTAMINLVLVGLALFLLIKAYNHLKQRMATEVPDPDAPVVISELSVRLEIRDALKSQR